MADAQHFRCCLKWTQNPSLRKESQLLKIGYQVRHTLNDKNKVN
jgi:hypothetical protein